MVSTLIFDLDGLLIDSESLHFQCWRDTLATVGVDLDEACFLDHWTRAGLGIHEFCQRRSVLHDAEALRRQKTGLYEARVPTCLKVMNGARELLERVHGRRRLALGTAGYLDAVSPALDAVGIKGYFEVIVSRNDVKQFKPAPDVFLRGAELLSVSPRECVVLEDAEKGVRAAHAAGMRCIAVPTRHTRDNDFSLATRVVSSLREVTDELLDAL